MTDAYYQSNNPLLFSSLVRYASFVLTHRLTNINDVENLSLRVNTLFVMEEEENINEVIKIIKKTCATKVVVIGTYTYLKHNYINILDTINLKESLSSLFTSKNDNIDYSGLINISVFREKVNRLFHGHGEFSLLKQLNEVHYYCSNGPKVLQNELVTWEEYNEHYLRKCKNSWKNFIERLEDNKTYLEIIGYEKEISSIFSINSNISEFLHFLDEYGEHKTRQISLSYINKNVDFIKKIDNILTKIKNDINL